MQLSAKDLRQMANDLAVQKAVISGSRRLETYPISYHFLSEVVYFEAVFSSPVV